MRQINGMNPRSSSGLQFRCRQRGIDPGTSSPSPNFIKKKAGIEVKRLKPFIQSVIILLFIIFLSGLNGMAQTVFSDDFSTNTNSSWTTSGVINSSAWSVARSGDDWGARRNTAPAQLELTNDASGIGNVLGWVFAYTNTGSYAAPYNQVLNLNEGLVTWTFNMRQIRSDPSGFSENYYGVAFILGSTSTLTATGGTGYAVVLGQSGAVDPVRLAKFTNGLQGTLTNLITSNTTGLTDFGAEYLSIKVTYDPTNNQWQLFLRNDGATSFSDPATGTLISQGIVTNNSYTSISLPYSGGYWQGSNSASQTSFFDNVKVTSTQTSMINVAPTVLSGFSYPLESGPSASQTFSLSGTDLTPATGNIQIKGSNDFEVSLENVLFTDSLLIPYVSDTLPSTIVYVRLKAGLIDGSYIDEDIACSGGGAITKNVTVSGDVFKTEPGNNPTGLSATSVSYSHSTVTVSWTDVTDTVLPDGYLIKGSTVGFSAIDNPVDGTVVSDGGLNKNVLPGNESFSFTGLSPSTSYYFKIFPYTNAGTDINYKTNGIAPSSSATTIAAPAGTMDNPNTCDQGIENNTGNDKWVYGYIVGVVIGSVTVDMEGPYTSGQNLNIVISDDMYETAVSKMLYIQLPNDPVIRTNLNLYDCPSNYHKRVVVRGDLQPYWSPHKGMINTDDYRWYEPTSSVISGSWNTSSSWSTGIPYQHDDVTLSDTIHINGSSQCQDLMINPIGSQIIDAGKTLIVNGSITLISP
jgi:hypothetical protein